jgi:hypothetical protein
MAVKFEIVFQLIQFDICGHRQKLIIAINVDMSNKLERLSLSLSSKERGVRINKLL